jgi:hypothetical protein
MATAVDLGSNPATPEDIRPAASVDAERFPRDQGGFLFRRRRFADIPQDFLKEESLAASIE